MGWLLAAAVITGLVVLPIRVILRYDESGAYAAVKFGPLRLTLYPAERKKRKKEKTEKRITPSITVDKKEKSPKKTGGEVKKFLPLIKIGIRFLNTLRIKLRVSFLELKLILAGDDPCSLALNYGRTWAALGNLMPHLERFLNLNKRDIEVECDFTDTQTRVYFYANIWLSFGRCVCIAAQYGYLFLRQYLKLNNTRKGGASV